MIQKFPRFFWPILGAVALAVYCLWIKPPGSGLGYAGDMCSDILRQLMGDHFKAGEGILFHSDKVLAPVGASVPYMSWAIERDWFGAFAWNHDREFPFLWVLASVSWLISYFGSAFFMRRMKIGWTASWMLALAATLLHFPRHLKLWHHYDVVIQDWVYLAFFLDAWIWQRFWRENRWSPALEGWRLFFQLGVFMITGYYWAMTAVEWLIFRLCLLVGARSKRARGIAIERDGSRGLLIASMVACAALAAFEAPWFIALAREVRAGTPVSSEIGWYANPLMLLRPVWLEPLLAALGSAFRFKVTETYFSPGWCLVIPAFAAVYFSRKKRGGPGLAILAPFLATLVFIFLYVTASFPEGLRRIIPLLSFVRVASRWGLVLPPLFVILVALAWPELRPRLARLWAARKAWVAVFAVSCLAEAALLAQPINLLPEMPADSRAILASIREQPGDTVLDLPFCITGGNGVCDPRLCPAYPRSVMGQCLRQWHEKKVYGLYHARMLPSQCSTYEVAPYTSWFDAWGSDRCFTQPEWEQFCGYLDSRRELSAILVYPGLWTAASKPECSAEFERRLGAPQGRTVLMTEPTLGGKGKDPTTVLWYAPRCRR